jgi:cytochrome c-type biogenesis protein CcmH/NrfG
MKNEENQAFRAIAARIDYALALLIEGDSVKAMSVLQRLLKVLPPATQQNKTATSET